MGNKIFSNVTYYPCVQQARPRKNLVELRPLFQNLTAAYLLFYLFIFIKEMTFLRPGNGAEKVKQPNTDSEKMKWSSQVPEPVSAKLWFAPAGQQLSPAGWPEV